MSDVKRAITLKFLGETCKLQLTETYGVDCRYEGDVHGGRICAYSDSGYWRVTYSTASWFARRIGGSAQGPQEAADEAYRLMMREFRILAQVLDYDVED